ncbi:unnamed protein product [Cutaneotrichosporon oleaginosum]
MIAAKRRRAQEQYDVARGVADHFHMSHLLAEPKRPLPQGLFVLGLPLPPPIGVLVGPPPQARGSELSRMEELQPPMTPQKPVDLATPFTSQPKGLRPLLLASKSREAKPHARACDASDIVS